MSPLKLAAGAVLAVILAYAVFYWTSAGDVKAQLEAEQALRASQEEFGGPPPSSGPTTPMQRPRTQPVEPRPVTPAPPPQSEPSSTELMAEMAAQNPGVQSPPDPVEDEAVLADAKREENYLALERSATSIASRIQRIMGRGEELQRGRRMGAMLLQGMGHPVNSFGEYESPEGSIVVDVKGPDLITITGTSQEFNNQVEVSVIGPRSADVRVRRVH